MVKNKTSDFSNFETVEFTDLKHADKSEKEDEKDPLVFEEAPSLFKKAKKTFYSCLPIIHYMVIFLLILPPLFFTEPGLLLLYAAAATATILHWKFLNNECVLTRMEKENNPESFKNAPEQGFIRKIFSDLGMEFLNKQKYLTEKVLLILILISLYKTYNGLVARKCKKIWI